MLTDVATPNLTPTNRTILPRPHFQNVLIFFNFCKSFKFLSICQQTFWLFFPISPSFVNFYRFAKKLFATPTPTPTNTFFSFNFPIYQKNDEILRSNSQQQISCLPGSRGGRRLHPFEKGFGFACYTIFPLAFKPSV